MGERDKEGKEGKKMERWNLCMKAGGNWEDTLTGGKEKVEEERRE